jgi:ComF family protein
MTQLFWGLAPVSRAAALFFYEPHAEAAQLIYDLKYADRPDIGEDIGRMMAEEMRMADYFAGVDVIIPVPLSSKRKRQRGYNQSEMIARGIHEITHIPVMSRALKRKHFHQSQTSLMRHQRQENVAEMFELRDAKDLEGKHILFIDDVCTTGATLTACANVLKDIPGIRISVLTLGFTKS